MRSTELLPNQSCPEAEREVLGALLMNPPQVFAKIHQLITAQDFYDPQHRRIFAAVVKKLEAGLEVSYLALLEALDAMSTDSAARHALDAAMAQTITTAGVVTHANIVRREAQRRAIAMTGHRLLEISEQQSKNGNLDELVSEAQNAMLQCFRPPAAGERFSELMPRCLEFCETASRSPGEVCGLATGFCELDKLTGGYRAGQKIAVAARVAMGKTSLVLHAAIAAGAGNAKVLFISLEMSALELGVRALAAESRLSFQRLWTGRAQDQLDLQRVAASYLKQHFITVLELGHATIGTVMQAAKMHQMAHGLDLLVIDNVNLLHGATEYRSMSEISRLIKVGAKDLGIPILAVYQLKREVDSHDEGRPLVTDLKQSGQIEADADLILLLYRENFYKRERLSEEPAELIVAKNRTGPVGSIALKWVPVTMSFRE